MASQLSYRITGQPRVLDAARKADCWMSRGSRGVSSRWRMKRLEVASFLLESTGTPLPDPLPEQLKKERPTPQRRRLPAQAGPRDKCPYILQSYPTFSHPLPIYISSMMKERCQKIAHRKAGSR